MKKISVLALGIVILGWTMYHLSSPNTTSTLSSNKVVTSSRIILADDEEESKIFLARQPSNQPEICQYNFDATQEDYDLWNIQNIEEDTPIKKFPEISGQKFSFRIDPMTANEYSYIEYTEQTKIKLNSINDIGDFVLPYKGIIALEIEFKIPTIELGQSNYISTVFLTGTTNNRYTVRLHYGFNSGAYSTDFGKISPNVNYSLTYRLSNLNGPVFSYYDSKKVIFNTNGYQRLGIYINQDAKQVGFILNGVDLGYKSNLPAPLANLSLMLSSSAGVFSEHLFGQELSTELITDRNALQFNYPQGTTDMCGNAI
ncbi:DUF4882 domain-containing protein [Acinetobacter sp. 1124_18A]|uniref:DUF4882 family protein n=1 Tax=Acinetobacter sp. 1124_18A TaxID=2605958 RepID=UPI00405813C2